MGKKIGTNALARALDITPAAVSKAAKEGRIKPVKTEKGRPVYDLDACRLAGLADNIQANGPAKARQESASPVLGNGDVPTGGDLARFNKARADAAELQVEQERMKLAALQKSLLSAEEIKLAWTQFIRDASQSFSGIAQKTLSRFPGLGAKGRDFIQKEIRRILNDLGSWAPGDAKE